MATHSSTCSHSNDKKRLKQTIFIASVFTLIELLGGFVSGSLALLSDAFHLFSDVGSLALSLVVLNISQRPANERHTYGYQRAEALGAFCSSLLLWMIMALLVYEGIERLFHPEPIDTQIVLITALFAIVANVFMIRLLHSHSHSLNIRAAYLHVLSDLLGSLGVVLSAVLLWLTGWHFVDPLITFFISALVIHSSYQTMVSSANILMESSPKEISSKEIQKSLESIDFVQSVHKLHVWSLSSKVYCLTAHLVVEKDPQKTLQKASTLLKTTYQLDHITLQIEPADTISRSFDC